MKRILIDSGPLIALFDGSDNHHQPAKNFIKNNTAELVTSLASITETLYLLDFNRHAQLDFLDWVQKGAVTIAPIENSDLSRIRTPLLRNTRICQWILLTPALCI